MKNEVTISEITRLCFGTLFRIIALILFVSLPGDIFIFLVSGEFIGYGWFIITCICSVVSYVIFPHSIIKWLKDNYNKPVNCK